MKKTKDRPKIVDTNDEISRIEKENGIDPNELEAVAGGELICYKEFN